MPVDKLSNIAWLGLTGSNSPILPHADKVIIVKINTEVLIIELIFLPRLLLIRSFYIKSFNSLINAERSML